MVPYDFHEIFHLFFQFVQYWKYSNLPRSIFRSECMLRTCFYFCLFAVQEKRTSVVLLNDQRAITKWLMRVFFGLFVSMCRTHCHCSEIDVWASLFWSRIWNLNPICSATISKQFMFDKLAIQCPMNLFFRD